MKNNQMSNNTCFQLELWIDSDSIPKNLRSIILKAAVRIGCPAFFVADRTLIDIEQFIQENTFRMRQALRESGETDKEIIRACKSKIHMIVVQSGENSADNYIVDNSSKKVLCITHDIPLASRMLEKGAYVIDDRGESFTTQNINVRLSDRLVNQELREMGLFPEYKGKMKESDSKAFADNFDRTLTNILKSL